MGELVPILVKKVLPGDVFRCKTEAFLRFAPMLAPIMHRVDVYVHSFFVPDRIVMDEFEDFITGGRLGTSTTVMAQMNTQDIADNAENLMENGTLWDYMGLPRIIDDSGYEEPQNINALPFRAYQLIYDEYFRDQNVTAPLDISKASGSITDNAELTKLLTLRMRAWEKDYFTSALPFAQRGTPVEIPIDVEGFARVVSSPVSVGGTSSTVSAIENPGATSVGYGIELVAPGVLPEDTDLFARIENLASSTTITELRRSIQLQAWLEANATGGARYIEQLLMHWGVISDDARLQRPEYLGGGKAPVQISEVLSTFQSPDGTGVPQGDMAGHAYSVGNQNFFKRRFKEHGTVISLMSVLPKTAYYQGIPREFSYLDKFDYPWPEFANIGEQEVLKKELFVTGHTEGLDEVFGYQSRYAEAKYMCSTVHGEMRDTLAFWHMGRQFSNLPALNTAFVQSNPTDRIFAVDSELPDPVDHLYCYVYHDFQALRPLPYYGTPSI